MPMTDHLVLSKKHSSMHVIYLNTHLIIKLKSSYYQIRTISLDHDLQWIPLLNYNPIPTTSLSIKRYFMYCGTFHVIAV